MLLAALNRIRDYHQSHGTAYTLKRLGQKTAQLLLGTYERRWRRERASGAELEHQRENQPGAGLISLVTSQSEDLIYYICAAVMLATSAVELIIINRSHNEYASRPVPFFGEKEVDA